MIKNYIFDFGAIFINLDKNATERELEKLGILDFTSEMLEKNQLYEKGLISTTVFIDFYQTQFTKATRIELKNAWNKIVLDFPLYRLEFIEKFSKNNCCFLLSNINEMHLNFIKTQLGKCFYKRFYNCFEKVYYTHKINLRKPDAEIFKFVLTDKNLIANECFFIDDTKENTDIASKLGFKCWNINPDKEDVINLKTKLI